MPLSLLMYSSESGLVPARRCDADLLAGLKPGKYRAKLTKPRNPLVHRLYFAVIAAAALHWPEKTEPEPEGDEKLLRAWLQCKAGYSEKRDYDPGAVDGAIWLIEHLRSDGKYAFIKQIDTDEGGKFRVYVPQSIQYEELDENQFRPIKEAVFEIVEEVIGVAADQLLKETEAAA